MLAWLLAGHMVGDYIFQTNWMASGKATQAAPLFTHCAVYTLCVWVLSLPAGGLSWAAAAVVFLAHVVVDRRNIVAWWCKHVTRSTELPWLALVTDQSFHVAVLAAAALIHGVNQGI